MDGILKPGTYWTGIDIVRNGDRIGILRDGMGLTFSMAEIRWLMRNIPTMLKVGDKEIMQMIVPTPKRKPDASSSKRRK